VAIREAGGVPLLWKTGHSLIKAKLKETGAPFAGEMSGHLFFGERWYGFDDAMYTAGAAAGDPVAPGRPQRLARRAAHQLQHARAQRALRRGRAPRRGGRTAGARGRRPLKFPGGEVGTIDGLRVDFADGFGLIRGSNTTPVLVLRFEGHTPEALHRIEGQMMAALRSVKPDAQVAAAAH
jgi:phosphomannomutase